MTVFLRLFQEGFSLIDASQWLKIVRNADCMLFGSKTKVPCFLMYLSLQNVQIPPPKKNFMCCFLWWEALRQPVGGKSSYGGNWGDRSMGLAAVAHARSYPLPFKTFLPFSSHQTYTTKRGNVLYVCGDPSLLMQPTRR